MRRRRFKRVFFGGAVAVLCWVMAFRLAAPDHAPVEAAMSGGGITLNARQTGAPVSSYIFGVSVEWIDYGNFLLDPGTKRLRKELIEPLKALRLPIWRFPGGILSDHYHWRDGVGPHDRRPMGRNPMDNKEHSNDFGSEEFVELCRALGSEALITANAGTGTMQEMLEWQAWFASKGFPVRYWEIGNEIYLAEDSNRPTIPGNDRRIFKTADQYSRLFNEWSDALRSKDKSVLVGAIAGTSNTSRQNRNWLPTLLAGSAGRMDFISLHNGFAPLIFGRFDFGRESNRRDAYGAMYARTRHTAEDIEQVRNQTGSARSGRPSLIAITEHFPLFGAGGDHKQLLAILDNSRTQAAALFTASLFHEFMRREVWMANYNIATSKWFGALLTDTPKGIVKTPTYHVYDLYRNHFGTRLVDVRVDSPGFDTKQIGTVPARKGVQYLDAAGSRDDAGNIYLAVINRSADQPVEAQINLEGVVGVPVEVRSLSAPSLRAINGPALGQTVEPDSNIEIQTSSWKGNSGDSYSFPPGSVTVFKWRGRK